MKILTLIAVFLLALPAYAEKAVKTFYEQNKQFGLIACNTNPDHGLVFAPGTSAENIATVKANAAVFSWVDTIDPAPVNK